MLRTPEIKFAEPMPREERVGSASASSHTESHREKLLVKLNEILAPIRARLEALLAVVAEEFNVPSKELKGGVSTFAVLPARRVAVVLAVEFLNPPDRKSVV